MRRGVLGVRLQETTAVGAPASGVQLGTGQAGPMWLRLFRLAGTRVVIAAKPLPAQLLVIRAAAAGTPVQVVTARPGLWRPLLGGDAGHLVSPTEVRQASGGPTLIVDDRAVENRGPVELRPWQCRVEIRSQWTPAMLPSFATSDLSVFGALPAEFAAGVARAFGVPAAATEPLGRLDGGSFGLLRKGRAEYVSVNPTSAEGGLLSQAR